ILFGIIPNLLKRSSACLESGCNGPDWYALSAQAERFWRLRFQQIDLRMEEPPFQYSTTVVHCRIANLEGGIIAVSASGKTEIVLQIMRLTQLVNKERL